MDDIFYVCDRVLALFHGRNFEEADLHQTNRSEVIGWIMGTMDHKEVPAHDRI
jgi:simple sugar transport system ATP-binding protein